MQKTLDFLRKLKKNNNKNWFEAHRGEYQEALREFSACVEAIIAEIKQFDPSIKNVAPGDCLFRIYRDVRFARDKSPYKTNFGAFIKAGGRSSPGAGYYLHLEPGSSMLGGGIYMPPVPVLTKIRKAILADAAPLKKILESKEFRKQFGGMDDSEKLKNPPRGIDKDHPDVELLKHKHFTVMRKFSDQTVLGPSFLSDCKSVFRCMLPFNRYLNDAIQIA